MGGISGTDFLVSVLGLTQPKAGRGIVLPSVLIHFGEDPTVTTISLVTLAHTIRGLRKLINKLSHILHFSTFAPFNTSLYSTW